MRPDYKQARREMTGNMPTGEYRMDDMEFSITRSFPEWDRMVRELSVWPDQSYWTSWAEHIRTERE